MAAAAVGLVDDMVFGGIDLAGGYKSPGEVGVELGKKTVIAAAGVGVNVGFDQLGTLLNGALGDGFGQVVLDAGLAGAKTLTTSTINNAVNAVQWDGSGLTWNRDVFDAGFGVGMIAGVVASAVSAGVGSALGDLGDTTNKFLSGAIKLGTAAAGKTAEYATYAAYSLAEGGTLLDAYDNMGGLTINVANLGAILDLAGSVIARGNSGGKSIFKDGKVLQKLSGIGLLEVNFGSDGISTAIGMGGIDVGGALYEQVKRGIDYAALKKYAELDADKGAIAMKNYVNGDWTMENTSARLASGKDELRFEEEIRNAKGEMAAALTTSQGNGRLIQMVDSGNADVNAVRLGQESYRNGIIGSGQTEETVRAVMAHTVMAAKMALNGADFSGDADIMRDLYEFYKASVSGNMSAFTKYAMDSYDSSADFWRLTANGGLKYDGDGWLKREDGTYIIDANGNRIGAETIEAGLIKILGVDKNDKAAVALVQKLMIDANIQHTGGEDPDSWYWDRLDTRDGETVNLKALNMGKTITFGSLLAGGYGNSVSPAVFINGFDTSTDYYLYGSSNTKFKAIDAVPGYVQDRYLDLAVAKGQFYDAIQAMVGGDTNIVGKYQGYIYKG